MSRKRIVCARIFSFPKLVCVLPRLLHLFAFAFCFSVSFEKPLTADTFITTSRFGIRFYVRINGQSLGIRSRAHCVMQLEKNETYTIHVYHSFPHSLLFRSLICLSFVVSTSFRCIESVQGYNILLLLLPAGSDSVPSKVQKFSKGNFTSKKQKTLLGLMRWPGVSVCRCVCINFSLKNGKQLMLGAWSWHFRHRHTLPSACRRR